LTDRTGGSPPYRAGETSPEEGEEPPYDATA
jgi:hypothetical protein